MSIVIREQDILKKEPPHNVGFWDEKSIRAFQESAGINYGQAVFEKGVKPNREWSNDREFNGQSGITQVDTSALREQTKEKSEIDELKATIQSMEAMIKSLAMTKPLEPLTNVERHGLVPDKIDKRTREYKESQVK